ncbi:MAG: metallophosphoesterase [Candidatus Aenigmarchaeota archaeon]|nr:metallophosphoesterase [Candidatus Aenigmarchaeota archaeon]
MKVKFVKDYPALFLSGEKILVIADLHLGFEHELFKEGIVIQPQVEKFKRVIDALLKITKAKSLIILGDVKHKVPGISLREMKEIPKFFSYLIEKVKVVCVKGNHDDTISSLLPKEVKVFSSRGFRIKKYGFFHGHAWPSKSLMECDYLFMGHVHPCVEFKDKLGYRNIEQVWVKGKLDEKLVMDKYKIKKVGKLETIIFPTFNKLLGGIKINKLAEKELIGPILSSNFLEISRCDLYLLDGTHLGKVKDIT